MTGLLVGELRRLSARRLVRVILLLAGLVVALSGLLVFVNTEPLDERALGRAQLEEAARLERCVRGEGQFSGLTPDQRDVVCGRLEGSQVRDHRFHLRHLRGILLGTTAPLVVVGWLIGASSVGADWQSRTMTTLFTWEPRRGRVLVAKALACVVVVSVLTILVQLLVSASLLPSARFHGTSAGTGGTWLRSVIGVVLRGTALAAISSVIGLSVASIGRNTSAAFGAGFAYFVVVENALGSALEEWRRWLLLGNAIVLISGESGAGSISGRSVVGAGVFLTVMAAGLLYAAVVWVGRSDVA